MRGRNGAGDNVHLHFKAHPAHSKRLSHIFLAVDHEFLVQHVQNLLVGRNRYRFGGFHNAIHIALRHFAVLDCNHAVGVETSDVTARDACPHITDLAIGHEFGFLERALDRIDGRLDVHHHAFLQSARWRAAHSNDLETAFWPHLRDDSRDLRRADVESDNQILALFSSTQRHVFSVDPVQVFFLVQFRPALRTANPFV